MATYYLTATAKMKNAKRHIVTKGTIEECRKMAQNLNKRYIAEIYGGKWNLVERFGSEEK